MGEETDGGTISSNDLRKEARGLLEVKTGDIVRRIWGNGFEITEMRVDSVDETFVYCDAQRSVGKQEWEFILGPDQERWKFDLEYGVETDEEQGWGVVPYAAHNIVLSRIVPLEEK